MQHFAVKMFRFLCLNPLAFRNCQEMKGFDNCHCSLVNMRLQQAACWLGSTQRLETVRVAHFKHASTSKTQKNKQTALFLHLEQWPWCFCCMADDDKTWGSCCLWLRGSQGQTPGKNLHVVFTPVVSLYAELCQPVAACGCASTRQTRKCYFSWVIYSSNWSRIQKVFLKNADWLYRAVRLEESGKIYLAHLEQMLSVTLACGSGW